MSAPVDSAAATLALEGVRPLERFRAVLAAIRYKDWQFRVSQVGEHTYYLQVGFRAPDSDTGAESVQRGRKWLLSEHMTESEIVLTAFKAVMTAEEHEIREQFLVAGVAVLGPHLDLFEMVGLYHAGRLTLSHRAPMPEAT